MTIPKITHPSTAPLREYIQELPINDLEELFHCFKKVSEEYVRLDEYNRNPARSAPLCYFIENSLMDSEDIPAGAQSILDYIAESISPEYYLGRWLDKKAGIRYTTEQTQECRCKWISEISEEIERCLVYKKVKSPLKIKSEQAKTGE